MHFLFSRIVVHVVHLRQRWPVFYSREAIPKSEGDFFSFRKAYVLKKIYFACMHRINYIGNRELVIENNLFI